MTQIEAGSKDLHTLLSEIPKTHGFVSLASLKECMTEQAIKDHMEKNGQALDFQFVLKRPRLFAMLVLSGHSNITSALHVDDEDDFFFSSVKEVPSTFWIHDPRAGQMKKERAEFFKLQSLFPPILTCKYPPQEFPTSFRPPFISESDNDFSGTFGIVRQVKVAEGHLPGFGSDELLAWKRIRLYGPQDPYLEEVKTLRSRRHQSLVPLRACYLTPNGLSHQSQDAALNLFFPWADTDMSNWMRPHDARPPEHLRGPKERQLRRDYLYDTILSLVSAVSYLHEEINGTFTSHHDLKPHNILLFGRNWKIGDLGMTRLRSLIQGSKTKRTIGSYRYHPPECEHESVKKHGRSFDIWSLGCIIVELGVLIVYGWEGGHLDKFQRERAKNPSQPSANSDNDDSFHNNMPVVRRWMENMVTQDGSSWFIYLMNTARAMLSMNRNARPYSWEVRICLLERYRPNKLGDARLAKMRALIQPPTNPYRHNPLVNAIDERNWDFVQCLQEKGWTLDSFSIGLQSMSGSVMSFLKGFKPSSSQRKELFRDIYDSRGFGSKDKANERRRDTLAENFAERVDSAMGSWFDLDHILKQTSPFDLMKILIGDVELNKKNFCQNTALFLASRAGDAIVVDILLRYGAKLDPINKSLETPLIIASKRGHAGVVGRLLVESKVSIDHKDNQGRTPLAYAAKFGHAKVVHLLLEYGANPQATNSYGRTPLSIAALYGNREIVALLLQESTVDPTKADLYGKTPLALAARAGKEETVELLLEESTVDPTTADEDGNTPLMHARNEYEHRRKKGDTEAVLRGYSKTLKLLERRLRAMHQAGRSAMSLPYAN